VEEAPFSFLKGDLPPKSREKEKELLSFQKKKKEPRPVFQGKKGEKEPSFCRKKKKKVCSGQRKSSDKKKKKSQLVDGHQPYGKTQEKKGGGGEARFVKSKGGGGGKGRFPKTRKALPERGVLLCAFAVKRKGKGTPLRGKKGKKEPPSEIKNPALPCSRRARKKKRGGKTSKHWRGRKKERDLKKKKKKGKENPPLRREKKGKEKGTSRISTGRLRSVHQKKKRTKGNG